MTTSARAGSRWIVRLLSVLKAAIGVLLVIGTAAATAWGGYRLALTSPRFAIQHLDVKGQRRLDVQDVRDLLGLRTGDNILALNLAEAKARLQSNDWVESASVSRVLPSTLRVRLVEHSAAALVAVDGELLLISDVGVPFKRWEDGDPSDLVVITGVSSEELQADRAAMVARWTGALRLLSGYGKLPVSRSLPAQEVHLPADGRAVLSVGIRGVALHMGKPPWNRKLLMVEDVLKTFQAKRDAPGVVFLDNERHPERVVVRMR